ncbi:MAG: ABC transporter ATP-binding protein [Betaproteobacteria bacterium]|nr:ABC transporter ATP-binding protein [Betaproteobacteria bacterium]
MSAAAPLLEAAALEVAVPGRVLVRGLALAVAPGERLVILGRNGSGKTTLLHTLAGLRDPRAGSLSLCGRAYAEHGPRQAARLRGLMAQQQLDAFPATVLETALVGRHPHLGRWAWEGAADADIARESLAAVGLAEFETRDVQTLSGGERQRLALATLLTQRPRLLFLDEPLAHLDLGQQVAALELLERHTEEHGAAAVMVLHDINLALRWAGRALLLAGDGRFELGGAGEVLTPERLGALFGHGLREVVAEGRRYLVPG